MLSFLQAIILGLAQGIAEVFPISGLGHSVLLANLFNWHPLTKQITAGSSAYLGLLAGMQLAIALALLFYYRREWQGIIQGLKRSLKQGSDITHDSDAKLARLLLAGAVPAILFAIVLGPALRQMFATGFFAIVFVVVNGLLLLKLDRSVAQTAVDRPRRRRSDQPASYQAASKTSRQASDHLTFGRAVTAGLAQSAGLIAGLSRSGMTMLAVLRYGLEREHAARFSFLLLTPVLFILGLFHLPQLLDAHYAQIRPQMLVGSVLAGVAAYFSVRFLDKYLRQHSLRRFGFYSIAAGVTLLLVSIIRGAA